MEIRLTNIGKRFKREWIFKKIDFQLKSDTICGIIGPNGSGKSTLLKLIAQAELASEGKIFFSANQESIPAEKAFEYISIATPYTDLPEQLTLDEFLTFHFKFSPLKEGYHKKSFISDLYLSNAINKQIAHFSSGMKQRLKLGLALLSQKPLVILDEPTSNLDDQGIAFYQMLLKKNHKGRIILIGSNEEKKELFMADETLNIADYK